MAIAIAVLVVVVAIMGATVLAMATMFEVLFILTFIFILIASSSLFSLLNVTDCLHSLAQASAVAFPDYSQVLHLFGEPLAGHTGALRTCSSGVDVCSMYRRSVDRKLELFFP